MFASIKRLSFKHKNNKFNYYLSNYLKMLTPAWFYQRRLKAWLGIVSASDMDYVRQRVQYYNKLSGDPVPLMHAEPLTALRWPKSARPTTLTRWRLPVISVPAPRPHGALGMLRSYLSNPHWLKAARLRGIMSIPCCLKSTNRGTSTSLMINVDFVTRNR